MKITKSVLEERVVDLAQNQLDTQIYWQTAFGKTIRRNEVVDKNPRDTIDTGETYDSVEAVVTDDKITVTFDTPEASYIFKWRSEIEELVGDSVANELAVDIVKMLLETVITGN